MINSATKDIALLKIELDMLLLKTHTSVDKSTQGSPNRKSSAFSSLTNPDSVAICFQIMTRAEPFNMVIATIQSLVNIKAPQDEIIIIDNNHSDTALYEPLQQFCKGLDDALNVHFYHEDYIAGYKAGALNLALTRMDSRCNYIVVVDSDYQALPHARKRIVSAIQSYPDQALLQFPQYYRDSDKIDIHSELNHYFSYHLRRRFNQSRALSTGTFAVINRKALLRMGGWSGESITEDAQMGVLMHRAGEQTQFIPEVIATGMLPQTLTDLIGQRRRWIYGNMQVLSSYFKKSNTTIKSASKIGFKDRIGLIRAHLSQLSAWVNFTGVFILLQCLAVILLLITTFTSATSLAGVNLIHFATNSLMVSYGAYAVYLGRRLTAYLKDTTPLNQSLKGNERIAVNTNVKNTNVRTPIAQRIKAFLVHISFWELGALSWFPVLWGQDKPFVCTPKLTATTSKFRKVVNSIMVTPKLLIGLNLITVGLVAPTSPVLFWCALSVVVVKLMASTVIIDNFVTKSTTKLSEPTVSKTTVSKTTVSESISSEPTIDINAKTMITKATNMTDIA